MLEITFRYVQYLCLCTCHPFRCGESKHYFTKSATTLRGFPLAAIVTVPPVSVDAVAAVAAEVPIAVASPTASAPAIVPAPMVTEEFLQ